MFDTRRKVERNARLLGLNNAAVLLKKKRRFVCTKGELRKKVRRGEAIGESTTNGTSKRLAMEDQTNNGMLWTNVKRERLTEEGCGKRRMSNWEEACLKTNGPDILYVVLH